jgi:hypothetical protein
LGHAPLSEKGSAATALDERNSYTYTYHVLTVGPGRCHACHDGVPVGVVPFGALKGQPACAACLDAIRDVGPGIEDVAEIPAHVQTSAPGEEVYL